MHMTYMNTFLPYESFPESAQVLDMRRLGKQRVECLQILRALLGETAGWRHHPAVKMWDGYECSLASYAVSICTEWIERGYADTCQLKIMELAARHGLVDATHAPPWLGDAAFHASHRSNLLRKDPVYYSQFGWTEPSDLPYVWPSH